MRSGGEISAERYSIIFSSMTEGVVIHDANGKITECNESAERILGLSRTQILGRTSIDSRWRAIHEDGSPFLGETHPAMVTLQTGKPISSVIMGVCKPDGRLTWIAINAAPLIESKYEPSGVVATFSDITEYRKSRIALHDAEANLSALIESTDDLIWSVDLRHGLLTFNQALQDHIKNSFGVEVAQGMRLEDVLPRERAALWPGLYARALAEGPFRTEYPLQDGRTLEMTLNRIVRNGVTAGVSVFGKDVTERKTAERALLEAEGRYREIFDGAIEGIYRTSAEGKALLGNPALARMLGYASAEEYLSTTADAGSQVWVNPNDRVEFLELLGEKGVVRGYECSLKRKDGATIWVSLNSRLVKGADGREVYNQGFIEDITERKKAQTERTKLEAEFIQAQKLEAVGRLAGGIAHDFNNLLMVIMAKTEVLALELEGAALEQTEEILKASRRAAELTGQLLAFSRKNTVQPTVISLNQLVSGVSDMVQRLVGEDVDVRVVLCEKPWRVKIDRSQFEQVIMNLLVNARDAMPEGGMLTLETWNTEIGEDYIPSHPLVPIGKYAMLAVTDTGTGMTADTKARLFEPFFTTKEPGKGTGLGLSMVYGIVKQSGGFIWVYSELGRGTCFKIYLPVVDGDTDAIPAARAAKVCTVKKKATILLVEDEDLLREVISEFLISGGHKVIATGNLEEACRLAMEQRLDIDLLLSDVVLKGGNSKQLVQRLTEQGCTFRVVYMSGYTPNAIVHHGVLDPGTLFLQKPFSQATLLDKIEEALSLAD